MKILAAKKTVLTLALASIVTASAIAPTPVVAQVVVADPTNLVPNMMSLGESLMQTVEQVESRILQYQQYENMVKNTIAPVTQVWSRMENTYNRLQSLNMRLQQYQGQLNNMNALMDRYRDINYYRNNNGCFAKDQICSASDLAKLRDQISFGSENVKKSNDALFESIVAESGGYMDEARELQRLQEAAGNDSGQMQALVRGNMLMANMANQILSMRRQQTQMLDQLVTRAQAEEDEQSRSRAADSAAHLVPNNNISSPRKGW